MKYIFKIKLKSVFVSTLGHLIFIIVLMFNLSSLFVFLFK